MSSVRSRPEFLTKRTVIFDSSEPAIKGETGCAGCNFLNVSNYSQSRSVRLEDLASVKNCPVCQCVLQACHYFRDQLSLETCDISVLRTESTTGTPQYRLEQTWGKGGPSDGRRVTSDQVMSLYVTRGRSWPILCRWLIEFSLKSPCG